MMREGRETTGPFPWKILEKPPNKKYRSTGAKLAFHVIFCNFFVAHAALPHTSPRSSVQSGLAVKECGTRFMYHGITGLSAVVSVRAHLDLIRKDDFPDDGANFGRVPTSGIVAAGSDLHYRDPTGSA